MDDAIKRAAGEAIRHHDRIRDEPVVGAARPVDIRRHLQAAYRFDAAVPVDALLDDVARMLGRGTVHSTHPAYFGPYNPGVLRSAIAASTLVAAYNPQAAIASHGAAAIEMEQHVLRHLAACIGYDPAASSAHFTSGGQEANTEALIAALVHRFPQARDAGLRSLDGDPRLYVSAEAHHSFEKAAQATGLGRASVRRIAIDASHRMSVDALATAIADDRRRGDHPFCVVATVGTTSTGAIDPIGPIADVCDREGAWLHLDAAFGGAALFSRRLREHLVGVERAHSVTWDAHKWLQMPLGAGMFFTRRPEALSSAFGTDSPYMPRPRDGAPDPFEVSMPWSRRAAGVPLFVALAELGHDGFERMIDRMASLGDALRGRLEAADFRVVDDTPLPVVAFTHPRIDSGEITPGEVARMLHRRGRCFVAPTELADGTRLLRACITNARTEERDLDVLIQELALAVAG